MVSAGSARPPAMAGAALPPHALFLGPHVHPIPVPACSPRPPLSISHSPLRPPSVHSRAQESSGQARATTRFATCWSPSTSTTTVPLSSRSCCGSASVSPHAPRNKSSHAASGATPPHAPRACSAPRLAPARLSATTSIRWRESSAGSRASATARRQHEAPRETCICTA